MPGLKNTQIRILGGLRKVRRKMGTARQTCRGAGRKKLTRWPDQAGQSFTYFDKECGLYSEGQGRARNWEGVCNQIHVSEEKVSREEEEEPKRKSRGQLNVVRENVTEIVTS